MTQPDQLTHWPPGVSAPGRALAANDRNATRQQGREKVEA